LLQAEGLTRRYGRFTAVRDVGFGARAGEVVGLLGQNGAGKTTVMNMLAGCLAPTSGAVRVCGADMETAPGDAKRHLGYLPERPPVYPEMTVREYLRFCCRLKGVLKADIKAHVEEIIGLTGLDEVGNRLVGQLSRGFAQRTGMAQALCGDPEVLLLDEPTAGFDPLQAAAFRKLIRRLSKNKVILFSTHLLPEVQAVCDRVLILHAGQLRLDHSLAAESAAAQRFRLAVAAPGTRVLSPLRALPSVRRVREDGSGTKETRVTVETSSGGNFQEELFTLLTGLGAPILELTPLSDSLESLFMRVTGSPAQEAP